MVILGGWVFLMSEVPELVFKARRLLYHSTLGSRVVKKKKKVPAACDAPLFALRASTAPGSCLPFDAQSQGSGCKWLGLQAFEGRVCRVGQGRADGLLEAQGLSFLRV
jgi:hypothetical protein